MVIPNLAPNPYRPREVVTYSISVAGGQLPSPANVQSIEIEHFANRVSIAEIRIQDGDPANQVFPLADDDFMPMGAEIEISIGYSMDDNLLFRGTILRQRLEVNQGQDSVLIIEAKNAATLMTMYTHSRVWASTAPMDICQELGRDYNIDVNVPVTASPALWETTPQTNATDWDFLCLVGTTVGYDVYTRDDGIELVDPTAIPVPAHLISYGRNVLNARLEFDGSAQMSGAEVEIWSPADQETETIQAQEPSAPVLGDRPQTAQTSDARLREREADTAETARLEASINATLLRRRLSTLNGEITVLGDPDIVAGHAVNLAGFAGNFNGAAYVSGVRHIMTSGLWHTEMTIGLDQRLGHHLVRENRNCTTGLMIGTVRALEGDPIGEERVEVIVPTLADGESEGAVWARLMQSDAGDGRGFSFRPDIGDEVVLGWLDGQAMTPVLLGSLRSSTHPSPIPPTDDNHQKSIQTRSGIVMSWDDEKSIFDLLTPGGCNFTLTDEDEKIALGDQHGNSIVMDSDGVKIGSQGIIHLTADQDLTLEGQNIEIKASQSFKAEGGSGAELKSSGSTVVKGSLVEIN